MLKIRLQRVGRKHEPSFRLVLTDSKNSTKSGRFKEILGSYDPRKTTDSLNADRIKYWISQGAGLTDTAHNLLVKHRVITAKKINVSAKSKKAPKVEEVAKTESILSSMESTEVPLETKEVSEMPEEPKVVEMETQDAEKNDTNGTIQEAPTSIEEEVGVQTSEDGKDVV